MQVSRVGHRNGVLPKCSFLARLGFAFFLGFFSVFSRFFLGFFTCFFHLFFSPVFFDGHDLRTIQATI